MNEQIGAHNKIWIVRGATTAAVVVGALLIGSIVAADKHHYRNSPDSFLSFQVDSTSELVEAIRNDPALRRRYARHFGIPENSVIDFVKNALVPYRLPEDRVLTSYGVTKTGRIYGVRTRMRKGTRVWANRSGVPILKWLCANPLTKTLPGTKIAKAKPTKPKTRTRVAGGAGLAPILPGIDLPIAAEPLMALPPVETTALTTPNIPVALVPSALTPGPVVAKANYGLLFPVGLVLLSTLNGGNGGSGSAISPVGPPSPEAPEPGSIVLIAAALPLMGGALYRRAKGKVNG